MTTTIRSIALLLALFATISTLSFAQDSDAETTAALIAAAGDCGIDCLHDTKCVQGEANFTWHPARPDTGESFDFSKEISRHGYHCGCPPGLTGLRCGRKYESCNDGTHTCFNGGQCLATLEDIYQNEQQYCNCPATVKEDGTTVRYSGKYCEVEVVHKDSRCTEEHNICQNGGTCKKEVDEIDPCNCQEGYVGRMCEFFEPSVPRCTLRCQQGGSCRYGTKTENHTLVLNEPSGPESQTVVVQHQDYQYCECPLGFLGNLCENEEVLCGNIKCYHGSECISVTDEATGKTDNHCDCHKINDKKVEKGKEVQFAGRHCEIKNSIFCNYDDGKTSFCTHNATCPELAHHDCGCLDGFHGPHCQFVSTAADTETSTAADAPVVAEESHNTCALKCKNDGHCRKGSKNDAHVEELLSKYGSELGHLGLNVTHSVDVEHCACPDGFVGLECEYSMTTCGKDGSEHPCFAGSTCTMVNDVPTCMCENADTASAGIYCQHKPSDVCTASKKEQRNGNRGFCTNSGACVTKEDGVAACRCHTEFEGPHCEYAKNATTTKALTAPARTSDSSSSGTSSTRKLVVALTVMICATLVAFGVVAYRRRKMINDEQDVPALYPDLDNSLALDDHSLRSCPVVDVGPEKDFDGNELKDVEFI